KSTTDIEFDSHKIPVSDQILAAVLGVIVVVMFFQVVFRYVFNNSITWSEELIRYLFVWITFFGTALCFRDRIHIGVDFFLEQMPPKLRQVIERFNLFVMILFTMFLLISGLCWMVVGGKSIGSSIPVPINFALYGAMPFSCFWILVYLIRRFDFKEDQSKMRSPF